MIELNRSARSQEELAREVEPSAQSISNWVRLTDRDPGRSHDGLTSAAREEHGIGTRLDRAARVGEALELVGALAGQSRDVGDHRTSAAASPSNPT